MSDIRQRAVRMDGESWARICAGAKAQGLSASEYVTEAALGRAEGRYVEMVERAPSERIEGALIEAHVPRPGVRLAMMCRAKDCTWRQFGDPKARCPEHGDSRRQPNHPYRGQSTEPSEAQIAEWARESRRPASHFM